MPTEGEQSRPAGAVSYIKTNAKTIGIVVLVVFLASAYFHQLQTTNSLKKQTPANTQATAKAQALQLRNEVGQLFDIPSNETPTVATVSDVAKLKNQAFFANAQNGDKVLLFSQAKEAVLYRPSTHKIIQVAPLNLGNTGATASSSINSN